MSDTMPTELTAGRVVLRQTREDDAAALAEAVENSLDHLRPWMARATPEAATLAGQRERCRQAQQLWRDDQEYATEAVRVLTPPALRLPGVERVEVHCDEANTSSAAIPKRLEFRLDRVEHRDPSAPGESGRLMIWVTP